MTYYIIELFYYFSHSNPIFFVTESGEALNIRQIKFRKIFSGKIRIRFLIRLLLNPETKKTNSLKLTFPKQLTAI